MTKQIEWKLVPVEPTAKMLRCGQYQDDGVEGTYARMLAAAPPVEQEPVAYIAVAPDGHDSVLSAPCSIPRYRNVPLYSHPAPDQSAEIERLKRDAQVCELRIGSLESRREM